MFRANKTPIGIQENINQNPLAIGCDEVGKYSLQFSFRFKQFRRIHLEIYFLSRNKKFQRNNDFWRKMLKFFPFLYSLLISQTRILFLDIYFTSGDTSVSHLYKQVERYFYPVSQMPIGMYHRNFLKTFFFRFLPSSIPPSYTAEFFQIKIKISST